MSTITKWVFEIDLFLGQGGPLWISFGPKKRGVGEWVVSDHYMYETIPVQLLSYIMISVWIPRNDSTSGHFGPMSPPPPLEA